jgi:RNA polymerase sigma-70 factor (ECF subfamily)
MTAALIDQARAGDKQAFAQLVAPHEREIRAHCYQILGSVDDAEDQLQETLLAAWQHLPDFEGRASIRTWLYRIATNRCLNALRSASRRPLANTPLPLPEMPQPNHFGEIVWLDPYPDVLLEGMPDHAPGPEAQYETTESISLAFVTALQQLPPRQRGVLVLRDVLGFRAKEVADMLDSSEDAVNSLLKRARATLTQLRPAPAERDLPPPPCSPEEQRIVDELTRAYENGDVNAVVALLTDDAVLIAPHIAPQFRGRERCEQFLAYLFRGGRKYQLVPTRANGQPAFGIYVPDPHAIVAHANGLLVLTLAGDRISTLTRFDNRALAHFGLPRTLPDAKSEAFGGAGLPN